MDGAESEMAPLYSFGEWRPTSAFCSLSLHAPLPTAKDSDEVNGLTFGFEKPLHGAFRQGAEMSLPSLIEHYAPARIEWCRRREIIGYIWPKADRPLSGCKGAIPVISSAKPRTAACDLLQTYVRELFLLNTARLYLFECRRHRSDPLPRHEGEHPRS